MPLKLLSIALFLFLVGCTNDFQKVTTQVTGNHLIPKSVPTLSSEEGQSYLKGISTDGLNHLKKFWIAQEKNFCGVCSAVITVNTLRNNKKLNQTNFFTPQVTAVIPAATVTKMGMTLRELEATLKETAPEFKTQKYYSHVSGLDLFKHQLKNWDYKKELLIVNFSRQSIAGTGMYSGHFSIIAGYNQQKRQVLILEVNGEKESFWISDRDLYTAMKAIDPVSKIPRGWIHVQTN